MPDPNSNQPVNQNPVPADVPSGTPVHTDLPPLPPDFQKVVPESSNLPPVDQTVSQPTNGNGSAAPSDLPPMVAAPKKKFGGKKIIATILGIFLLVGGVGAGVILTQQQQLFQQKAAGTGYNLEEECEGGCPPGKECKYDGSSMRCVNVSPTNPPNSCATQACPSHCWCDSSYMCHCPGTPTDQPGPNGPTDQPGPTASCKNIKAYNSAWTLLIPTELSVLTSGTVINLCVTGTASSGLFDKAKLTINGNVQPETTTTRPSSTDFCQSYTIPEGVATFNVSAQIHHTSLGWK